MTVTGVANSLRVSGNGFGQRDQIYLGAQCQNLVLWRADTQQIPSQVSCCPSLAYGTFFTKLVHYEAAPPRRGLSRASQSLEPVLRTGHAPNHSQTHSPQPAQAVRSNFTTLATPGYPTRPRAGGGGTKASAFGSEQDVLCF